MFNAVKVDGMIDCQQILEQIQNSDIKANFVEGMACKGGCVGGPGRIIPPAEGTGRVNAYGDEAASQTPVENPQVYSLLARLGHESDIPALTGEGPMAALLARKLAEQTE